MARVLARVINGIDDRVDGEALNQTLNIIEIDAASNNKVEDVHHSRSWADRVVGGALLARSRSAIHCYGYAG